MSENHYLTAYLATLGALVAVFVGALAFGAFNPAVIGKIEAFGLGTITGGLIGVLRLPSMRTGGVSDQTAQTLADKVPPVTTDDKDGAS